MQQATIAEKNDDVNIDEEVKNDNSSDTDMESLFKLRFKNEIKKILTLLENISHFKQILTSQIV